MDFKALSDEAAKRDVECSQQGDIEGSFYARGLRDAYATAAVFTRTDGEQVIYVRGYEWCVSYTTHSTAYSPEAVLNVFKIDYQAANQWGGRGVVIRHPDDGRVFDTLDDARSYAMMHNLIHVYQKVTS